MQSRRARAARHNCKSLVRGRTAAVTGAEVPLVVTTTARTPMKPVSGTTPFWDQYWSLSMLARMSVKPNPSRDWLFIAALGFTSLRKCHARTGSVLRHAHPAFHQHTRASAHDGLGDGPCAVDQRRLGAHPQRSRRMAKTHRPAL